MSLLYLIILIVVICCVILIFAQSPLNLFKNSDVILPDHPYPSNRKKRLSDNGEWIYNNDYLFDQLESPIWYEMDNGRWYDEATNEPYREDSICYDDTNDSILDDQLLKNFDSMEIEVPPAIKSLK